MSNYNEIYEFVSATIINDRGNFESNIPSPAIINLHKDLHAASQTLRKFMIDNWAENDDVFEFLNKLRAYGLANFTEYDLSDAVLSRLVSRFTTAIYLHKIICAVTAFYGLINTKNSMDLSIEDEIRISSLIHLQCTNILSMIR